MKLLEAYVRELRLIRASGAGVPETSYYAPLAELLNAVGRTLKPRVHCIMTLKNQGAGLPDGGLFTPDQFQRGEGTPLPGQIPSRGAVEIKPVGDDAWLTAGGSQVSRYWDAYRQLLVTNYRDFVLVGQDGDGKPAIRESFRLAQSEADFWAAAAHPARLAQEKGTSFEEFLKRVMLHAAPLATPRDLAWFLASYAREAKARVDLAGSRALGTVRAALEEGLGMKFQGRKGEHFFRSTLVQTLFYGVFSAWVLWSKQHPSDSGAAFNWQTAAHYLRVPVLRKLFYEVAEPGQLETLNLPEVLDWAGELLNRVDRSAFFARFEEEHAVQYFYEPFLEAYDPELRKELGVWYTPPEIVHYMVERVDTALRQDLGIEDGLADPNVYVLDPCCGTGAYLVEVLRKIEATLRERRGDALVAGDVREAARSRIFGFEIMPAPFVVAHLQLGLLLQALGAPFSEGRGERPAVFLTNALTGWEPPEGPKQRFLFPEFEDEHEAADRIKQTVPILVVLGNPPYNGFAGTEVREEHDITRPYRATKRAPAPQGQGLNDLYVRFFRMAEHRIVEHTGRGVVCFISNYSWLDGLSFTGMRERYLEVFDRIWIDCLNGDKYKTGKLTPEGEPDPSVFSTETNTEGIQVGTAIATLVRKERRGPAEAVEFRHLWGKAKRAQLVETARQDGTGPSLYEELCPSPELGLPFVPMRFEIGYSAWPRIPDLFPLSFPGVKTSRDIDLVEIDLSRLQDRMSAYFDPSLSDDYIGKLAPSLMQSSARYDAPATRNLLLQKGMQSGHLVRFCYRPFDVRHLYWHPETKLLDEKREELFRAFRSGNSFLTCRQKGERQTEGSPFYITRSLPDWHLTRPGSICFPLMADDLSHPQRSLFAPDGATESAAGSNISALAREYLRVLALDSAGPVCETADLIWMHVLAVGHSPAYLGENSGALRQDWPRVPLPAESEALLASAELGRRVAALLDVETAVPGITSGTPRPEMKPLGLITRVAGSMGGDLDLRITVGWGHAGQGGVTMPGQGRLLQREYSAEELAALEEGGRALGLTFAQMLQLLGESTFDVYLNEAVFWKNVPARVWSYTLGGYQVIKKWLSYREHKLLGRALLPEEAREVTAMVRRIAALLLLEPELDTNYRQAKDACYAWPGPPDKGNPLH